ncbi:phage tail protein [Pseudomonas sp. TKO26]|uniref:phage tail protein n=1 Tax=unclassified Pseudomonas TaxID=196821 RepID=UPI000D81A71B|nr:MULTISPECIES: phage tail protein [unclassified Pseudomonas]PYY88557.1 phage tail protein [Pseudomonas sp. TKO30]PYY91417.1 phage tail protein [Pseudomonas sp. TKO29]PYY94072.1 phage tail protein [Pseudomonas sp. TKO26]PYZ00786.1 phage tail protein [Pseudomonas sp. TKO14]
MTDQNSQFFAILTALGEAKQANADALGIPWTFSQMGVGDANNTDPKPDRAQTKLINEWRRAPLNQLSIDPANPSIIVAEQVIPAEVGGKWIREVGLYDAAGDLVAVANCPPSYKPLLSQGSGRTQTVRMNLIVGGTANIELKIDPSVVLATRAYVDQRVTPLATQVQAEAGEDNTVAMTPLRVFQAIAKKLVQATELLLGVAKIATQEAVSAGEDDTTIVTPKKLAVPLKAKAPLDSPVFTGSPRAPKAAQFAAGNQIITAEALMTAGVQYKDIPTRDVSGVNVQLSVADVGRVVLLTGSGGGTVTLPKASDVPSGKLIAIRGANAKGTTNRIKVVAGDDLNGHFNEGAYAGLLRYGESVVFVSGGGTTWVAMSDSTYNFIAQAVAQQFVYGQSFGPIGYQQFPGGYIKQWGFIAYTAAGSQTLTAPLPIAFPNALLSGNVTAPSRLNNTAIAADIGSSTKTGLSIVSITNSGSGASTIYYEAWGH